MDKKEYYDNCEKCGRPFNYAPTPKCNQNKCGFCEQRYTMNACIRKQKPDCSATAVIPATTLETVDGLTNFSNAFVHVLSNNTTYYVDEKHSPIIIWAGTVDYFSDIDFTDETVDYSVHYNEMIDWLKANPLGLKSQDCYFYVKNYNYTTGVPAYAAFLAHYSKYGIPYLNERVMFPAERQSPIV